MSVQRRRSFADMLATRFGVAIATGAIVVALLVVWQLASGNLLSEFVLSKPSAILKTLWHWVATGSLWRHLGATVMAMSVGYLIGASAGVSLGLILGLVPRLERTVSPFLFAFYALPKIALAPLLVLLLGIDLSSKIALVSVTVVFIVLYSTLDGVRNVDRDLVESLRLMGGSRAEITRKILLPGSLAWIFNGMRISVRYAFTAAILGELIASNRGIGFLIESNAGQFDATGVFAAVFVLVLCSLALTEFLSWIEARLSSRGLSVVEGPRTT